MTKNRKVKRAKYDIIVVGGGLAGLSCAFYTSLKGKNVLLLEKKPYLGGRTSSFSENGMEVESGLHRYIGYYSALPRLLKKCGVKIKDIVTWEDKVDILINKNIATSKSQNGALKQNEQNKIVLGVAPLFAPIKTVRGLTQNREYLTFEDKKSLLKFFVMGMIDYLLKKDLDSFSVKEYATRQNVTKNAQNLILEPLSSGIFFLSTDDYSAFSFFCMFMPALPRFYKMRIGAFLGGMSDIMCEPIGDAIVALGSTIRKKEEVEEIVINNGKVIGVRTKNHDAYFADKVVVATPINVAKRLLEPLKSEDPLSDFFALKTMSACTLQIDLDKPALKKDITTFGPMTNLVSFAEQSRSTFRNKNGRLSIILGKSQKFNQMSAEQLLEIAIKELESFGINIKNHILDYRKVSEENEFYTLTMGNQRLRPNQKTSIPGLILAGDYTLTKSLCTMEGAVLSGRRAAKLCTKK